MQVRKKHYFLFFFHLFIILAFLPTIILSKGKKPKEDSLVLSVRQADGSIPSGKKPLAEPNPEELNEPGEEALDEEPIDASLSAQDPAPAPPPSARKTLLVPIKSEETLLSPRARTSQETRVHTVWIWQENGDCLWRLAKIYYNDPWKWEIIYLANKDTIADPKVIYPKQKIIIPPLNN